MNTRPLVPRFFVLATATLFLASPPAPAQDNVAEGVLVIGDYQPDEGPRIRRLELRYRVSHLMGEPLEVHNVRYWLGSTVRIDGTDHALEDFPPEIVQRLKISGLGFTLRARGRTANNLAIGPCFNTRVPLGALPRPGGSWGYSMGGSPDWDDFFENCTEQQAKDLFRGGFTYERPTITSISFLGISDVRSHLRQRERRATRIDDLLTRAEEAMVAGEVDDAEDLVRRLKRMEPEESRVEIRIAAIERSIEDARRRSAGDAAGAGGVAGGDAGSGGAAAGDDESDDDAADDVAGAAADSAERPPVLTPEQRAKLRQLEAEQALASWVDSEGLARALANESPGMQAVYLSMLGATMLMSVRAISDEDETESSDIPSQDRIKYSFDWGGTIATSVALLGPALLVPALALGSNDQRLQTLARDAGAWESRLRNECRSGMAGSCDDALALSREFRDLSRPASERRLSSPLGGLGSAWGPLWEFRAATGFALDAFATTVQYERDDPFFPRTFPDQVVFDGPTYAGTVEFVARTRIFRGSFSYTSRYGKLVDDAQYSPDRMRHTPLQAITSYGGGIGIQLAQGLFSPYAEARMRVNSMEVQQVARDEASSSGGWAIRPPQEIEVPLENDLALVVGNTFNFSGVRSTRGPYVAALVVDAAYVMPLGESLFDPGYSISVGYSVYQPFGFGRYAR